MRRFAIALLLVAAFPSPAAAVADSETETRCVTPLQLFARVETAWFTSDSEGLSGLADTTSVTIAVKPGAPPAAAMTRSAAAFLFQDQLRLVKTQSFQVTRVSVGRSSATAVARWVADWGGRQGVRDVEVNLVATPSGGRWLLTEVRAKD
ncbi:MAG TPA: hypothetical protein VF363_02475 [Candidatus Eisenbacteria bacterium]